MNNHVHFIDKSLYKKVMLLVLLLLMQITKGFGEAVTNISDTWQSADNRVILDKQLATIIQEMLAGNRSVEAARHRIEEADAIARSKTSLEPPRLEIGAMDATVGSFPNPFRDQMQMDYSLEQMIMFPAKLSKMKKAELKKKEMVQYDKETIERDLIRKVKDAFYEIYLIDRQMEINVSSQGIVNRIIGIARTQYEVGMGKQADILRAQTELSLLKKKMVALDQKRLSMASMINALSNRPIDTPIGTTPEIEPMKNVLSYDQLLQIAESNRPELKAMKADIDMKKTELSAANLGWYPDFMIRATYSDIRPMPVNNDPMFTEFGNTATQNSDRWSIMLGFTIPEAPWSMGKIKGEKKAFKAAIAATQEEFAEMLNMLKSEVFDAYTEVQSNYKQIQLTTSTLLPQAQQAFESALASYKTGGQEFTMLLDAQRMMLMARDDYHMSVMNYLVSWAKLERVAGRDLLLFTQGEIK